MEGVRSCFGFVSRESYIMLSMFWIDTICFVKFWMNNIFQAFPFLFSVVEAWRVSMKVKLENFDEAHKLYFD